MAAWLAHPSPSPARGPLSRVSPMTLISAIDRAIGLSQRVGSAPKSRGTAVGVERNRGRRLATDRVATVYLGERHDFIPDVSGQPS